MLLNFERVAKLVLSYNDFVVVLLNLEVVIVKHLFARPSGHQDQDDWSAVDFGVLVYINFLGVKQVMQQFYYQVAFSKHFRKSNFYL